MTAHELVQGWFNVRELEPGVHAIEEPLHDERVASFLIQGRDRALLIDAGTGAGDLRAVVSALTDLPVTLLFSHGHWDHIGSGWQFSDAAEILVHPLEADRLRAGVANDRMRGFFAPELLTGPLPAGVDVTTLTIPGIEPTGFVGDGDRIDLGGRTVELVHVPGHSPGLLALLDRGSGALFTTDAIYGGALYAHLAGVDVPAYRESARRLAALAPVVRNVYASHNERPLDPAILARADAAFDELAAGRTPEDVAEDVATHRFEGFSILVRSGSPA